jgi:HlyD family secretion protein
MNVRSRSWSKLLRWRAIAIRHSDPFAVAWQAITLMTKRSSPWKTVGLLLVVAAAVSAGLWLWRRPKEAPPEYQTVTVGRGELVQVVTATGTLNPVTNVTVGSQISGIIQKIYADFNSRVTAGQVIAQLDPATYEANVASAEGDLANARANLELAQVDFRRADELYKSRLIAQSEFDKASATLHQAEAQVKIREASLQRAKVDLSRCTIYSPVDGIVISRDVDVGQTVAASMSAPTLFIIANDLTKMQINAAVAEADVGSVEAGQDVEFGVDAFPFRTFRGKVTQVRNSPVTVQNVVTYDTIVEVNNADQKLKPGMTANVSIVVARRDNAVRIPNAALRFRPPETANGAASRTNNAPASNQVAGGSSQRRSEGGGRAGGGGGGGRSRGERSALRTVYTLGTNGQPEAVQIKVGISDGFVTEALSGLEEGAILITGQVSTKAGSTPTSSPFGGMPRRF